MTQSSFQEEDVKNQTTDKTVQKLTRPQMARAIMSVLEAPPAKDEIGQARTGGKLKGMKQEDAACILNELSRAIENKGKSKKSAVQSRPVKPVLQKADRREAVQSPVTDLFPVPRPDLKREHPLIVALVLKTGNMDQTTEVLKNLPGRIAEKAALAICEFDDNTTGPDEKTRKLIYGSLQTARNRMTG